MDPFAAVRTHAENRRNPTELVPDFTRQVLNFSPAHPGCGEASRHGSRDDGEPDPQNKLWKEREPKEFWQEAHLELRRHVRVVELSEQPSA